MFSTNLIGVLGIIITVILGFPALYIIVRYRYPGELILIRETSLALFDSLVKSFPELTINYKNAEINEGLVFLKGAVLNIGKKDIDETMVKKKLEIALPKDYKWISVKTIAMSPDFNASAKILDNKIEFTTGLFRCKEYFRFEALAEIPIVKEKGDKKNVSLEKKLEKGMHISHRIADTQKVKIKDLPSVKKGSRRLKVMLLPTLLIIVASIVFALSVFFRGWPAKTHFIIKNEENGDVKVEVGRIHKNEVKVTGVDDKKFKKQMGVEEFTSLPNIRFLLVCDKDEKIAFIMMIIQGLFILFMFGARYCEYREGMKLRKLLDIQ